MNMKLMVSVSAAFVITLITGSIDVTPINLVGAKWHGWPLAWFYVIVHPGSPISLNWFNLVADLIIWFVIALIVVLMVSKVKTPKTLGQALPIANTKSQEKETT
jgi:large-conductance mechanosensitive channel